MAGYYNQEMENYPKEAIASPAQGDILNMIDDQYNAIAELEHAANQLDTFSKQLDNPSSPFQDEKSPADHFNDIHRDFTARMDSVMRGIRAIRSHPDARSPSMESSIKQVNAQTRGTVSAALSKLSLVKEELVKRDARAVMIVNSDMTEAQAREYVQRENPDRIFAQAMMESYSKRDMDVLNNVRERNVHVTDLARQMDELVKLYQELQDMVFLQEETMQHIGDNIQKANVDTTAGAQQLSKAEDHARSANRWKRICIFILFLIVVIIVVILVVYFLVIKKENSKR